MVTSRAADPRTVEWWARRLTGFGGSDAPAIAGVSKWSSPRQVVEEKGRRIIPDLDGTERLRLRLGRELEPILRQHADELAHERGWLESHSRITSSSVLHRAKSAPWMIYNADGLGGDALVELKTDQWDSAGFHDDDQDPELRDHPTQGIPAAYFVQVQHGLVATGKRRALVFALIGLHERRLFQVVPDPGIRSDLMDAERDAWARVEQIRARLAEDPDASIDDLLPAVDGSDESEAWLRKRYPTSNGELVSASAEQELVVQRLRTARVMLAAAKREDDEATNLVRDLIGEADGIVTPFGTVTWRRSKDSTKTLRNDAAIAAAYRAILEDLLGVGDTSLRGALRDRGFDPDVPALFDTIEAMHETTETTPGSRRFLVPRAWAAE